MPVCLLSYDQRQKIVLDKAITLFGRHPECDVVFSTSRKVSRKHCCIANVNNSLMIRDLGSTNGVRINSKPVKVEQVLRLGDQVAIGDLVFTLQDEASIKVKPAAAAPSHPIEDDVILDEPTPLKPQAEDPPARQEPAVQSELYPVAIEDSSDDLGEPPSALRPLVQEKLESLTPPQKSLDIKDGELVPLSDDENSDVFAKPRPKQPGDSPGGK